MPWNYRPPSSFVEAAEIEGPIYARPFPADEAAWDLRMRECGFAHALRSPGNAWVVYVRAREAPYLSSSGFEVRYIVRYFQSETLAEDIYVPDFPSYIELQRYLAPVAQITNHFPHTWLALTSLAEATEAKVKRMLEQGAIQIPQLAPPPMYPKRRH